MITFTAVIVILILCFGDMFAMSNADTGTLIERFLWLLFGWIFDLL